MVTIDKNNSKPYYEQLVLSIKEDILQGVLQPGDKLPSVRDMAKSLLTNPNTVSKAYKVLETEQVLVTIKGRGTFVKAQTEHVRDEQKVTALKEEMKTLYIKAQHQQISVEEMTQWLATFAKQLGGNQ